MFYERLDWMDGKPGSVLFFDKKHLPVSVSVSVNIIWNYNIYIIWTMF